MDYFVPLILDGYLGILLLLMHRYLGQLGVCCFKGNLLGHLMLGYFGGLFRNIKVYIYYKIVKHLYTSPTAMRTIRK